ncbi:MAG: outer membrane protein [Chakrabartia sp.]
MKNISIKSALLVGSALLGAGTAHAEGLYIGAFGGIGRTDNQSVEQLGTAHKGYTHDTVYHTYDLPVDQDGNNDRKSSTVFGGQIGYEFGSSSSIKPAIEVEGLYLSANQEAALANPDDEVPTHIGEIIDGVKSTVTDPEDIAAVQEHGTLAAGTHTFLNTSKLKVGLFMLNGVVNFDKGGKLVPYVGAGVGMAVLHQDNAVSLQTGPGGVEQSAAAGEAVNHLNSRDHASDFAFAVQAKAGVQYKLSAKTSLFVEYRYINLAATEYTFGSTVYADHAATDAWVIKNGSMGLHNAMVGVRFGF